MMFTKSLTRGILSLLLYSISCLQFADTPPDAINEHVVYERDFCIGPDFDGQQIKVPCIDVDIGTPPTRYLFLINTGQLHSTADANVINRLGSEANDLPLTLMGEEVLAQSYSVSRLSLGGLYQINKPMPIVYWKQARYGDRFGISGVLGARDMKNLIWDLDLVQGRLRVLTDFTASREQFPVQDWFQRTQGEFLPSVQVKVAGFQMHFSFNLLEAETVQIGSHLQTLADANATYVDNSCNFYKHIDLLGAHPGQHWLFHEHVTPITLNLIQETPPYAYRNIDAYAGWDYFFGQGFIRLHDRVAIDLRKRGQLLLKPHVADPAP